MINNIQRSASLFLVKNIFSFLLTFISLFITMPYPLQPLQLSLLSMVTIGIPSFILALEPTTRWCTANSSRMFCARPCPAV